MLCLTATAKPDVKADIVDYFEKELGVRLGIFDGGTHSHRIELSIPVGTAVTVGMANVAVQITHRGQGIMTRMMLHQISYVHDAANPLAGLLASDAASFIIGQTLSGSGGCKMM